MGHAAGQPADGLHLLGLAQLLLQLPLFGDVVDDGMEIVLALYLDPAAEDLHLPRGPIFEPVLEFKPDPLFASDLSDGLSDGFTGERVDVLNPHPLELGFGPSVKPLGRRIRIDDGPGLRIEDQLHRRMVVEQLPVSLLAFRQGRDALTRRRLIRQNLAGENSGQRIQQDHGRSDALDHPPAGAAGQGEHQGEHDDMDDKAEQIKIGCRGRPLLRRQAIMARQSDARRRQDDQNPGQGAHAAEGDPAGDGQPGRRQRGPRSEVQGAEADHHRPPVEDQPGPEIQGPQHPDDGGPAKQHALQGDARTGVPGPPPVDETGDHGQGDEEGQVEDQINIHHFFRLLKKIRPISAPVAVRMLQEISLLFNTSAFGNRLTETEPWADPPSKKIFDK